MEGLFFCALPLEGGTIISVVSILVVPGGNTWHY